MALPIRPVPDRPGVFDLVDKVLPGDTIESIAQRHETSVVRLCGLNPKLTLADFSRVGTRVVVCRFSNGVAPEPRHEVVVAPELAPELERPVTHKIRLGHVKRSRS